MPGQLDLDRTHPDQANGLTHLVASVCAAAATNKFVILSCGTVRSFVSYADMCRPCNKMESISALLAIYRRKRVSDPRDELIGPEPANVLRMRNCLMETGR